MVRLVFILLVPFMLASSAEAADCLQEQAIYTDRDGAYTFAFEPVGSAAAANTNHFKVTIAGSDAVLDGVVLQTAEPVRPNGMIFYNCPEGDATGDDIAACTIWEGAIYSVAKDGTVDLLPEEGADAAETLLFPALGSSIRHSILWDQGKAKVAPWDVLTLKGCAP